MVKMKDSGIEWIGEIPETWEKVKFNAIYSNRNTKVSDREYAPLSVTKKGIVPQLATAAKTNDNDNRKLVKSGDFVINSRSDRRGSCGISSLDGSVSLINTVLEPKNSQMEPLYFDFLFHTIQFADEFYKWGHGIVDDLWTTNWNDMKNITLILPTRFEQQLIADFLDHKTAEIDGLIDKINTEIDTLKQYQSSVITQAVTKGLDPSVPMKDSGIEWIGDIPEKWRLVAAKRCIILENGSEPKTDSGDTPVYGSGSQSFRTCQEFKLGPTVLLGRKGTIDRPQWIEGKFWNIDTALNVRSKGINLKYYYYCSICFDYEWYVTQTAKPSMTQTDYYNMRIPLPIKFEQQQIVDYLDQKVTQIQKLINSKQQQINQLTEYKNSLIFEYVTGKKQVKEAN